MMAAIFAEYRKLASVRSTWIWTILGLLFTGFIAFWANGLKGPANFSSDGRTNYVPDLLQNAVLGNLAIASLIIAVVAILLICHEYRYNTIGYTLTASTSRVKVLAAKFIVITGFAAILTLFATAWIMGLTALGVKISGHDIGPQTFEVFEVLWRSLFFMISTGWLGLILGFLARSMVIAIVAFFVMPVIEQILHFLLKVSNNYLPSAVQGQVMQAGPVQPEMFSATASAGMFCLYLLAGLIVAIVLFVRRDSN